MTHHHTLEAVITKETLRHLKAGQRSQTLADHNALSEYAKPNMMAHHEFGPIKNGGMRGASEMLARGASKEYAKFMAGHHIRASRYHRADGNRIAAFKSLFDAAYFRKNAAERPSVLLLLEAA